MAPAGRVCESREQPRQATAPRKVSAAGTPGARRKALVTSGHRIPAVEKKVEFSLKSWKFVPASAGCYALSTFDLDVLYVGLTDNLHRRFSQHRETREKREPTSMGLAFWFHFLTCDEREINKIERTWLNEHMELHGEWPVLNKMNSPIF